MITQTIAGAIERDLLQLKTEIASYKNEKNLWLVKGHIANSGGNLAIHLVGSLNHFIGAGLAHSGYVRRRDAEFSDKNIPREKILADIDATLQMVKTTLGGLPATALEKEFPLDLGGKKVSVEYILILMATHLNYHLGQVNYHRRLLDE